jgi:hypothetical protein
MSGYAVDIALTVNGERVSDDAAKTGQRSSHVCDTWQLSF